MSINLPTLQVEEYSSNIQLLLQQMGSRFRAAVTEKGYTGSVQASPVDQVASTEAIERTTRFGDMPRIDATLDRRWVAPRTFHHPQLIDNVDLLKMLSDPKSSYVQSAVNALNRKIDSIIIDAFFDAANTGTRGGTSTAFLAGNVVGVQQGAGTNTGLTVAKLREARRLLLSHEVDLAYEQLYIAVTSKQMDNLLGEAQVISTDFNSKPVLVDGMINNYLGFNFIHSERLETGTDDQSGTSRAVPVWVKSGMHLGMWNDITTDISQRKDVEGLPWQVYVEATFGATRIEEKRVVKIWARE